MQTVKAGRYRVEVPGPEWWVWCWLERQSAKYQRLHTLHAALDEPYERAGRLANKAYYLQHRNTAKRQENTYPAYVRFKDKEGRIQDARRWLWVECCRIRDGAMGFVQNQLPRAECWDDRHYKAAAELMADHPVIAGFFWHLVNLRLRWRA